MAEDQQARSGSACGTRADAVPSDFTIVERVLAGDVDAYRDIVNRYQRQVYRLGFRFHRAVEDIQDYVQEVFLKAYLRLSQFRQRGRFYSWLMRIAYTQGIDRVERRSVETVPEECAPPDPAAGTEDQAIWSLVCDELRAAVAGLPRQVARCVELFYFFDLTYDEVSRVTGIGVNTVKSHVFRARRELRRRLTGTPAEAYYDR